MKIHPAVSSLLLSLALAKSLFAAAVLSPGDFIIAVDGIRNLPGNTNTGGEGPASAFDGNQNSKWLSFARAFAGLIVTPATPGTVVQSMSFVSGGDAPERDPVAYRLYGINSAVTSVNNESGLAESWTLISSGATGLAASSSVSTPRNTAGPIVSFANTTAYDSYKVVFTALRSANANVFDPVTLANGSNPNSVQVSEVRMFDSTNTNLFLTPPISVVAIDETDSFYPFGERPSEAIDGIKTAGSKYLNFGREGSGLIVTPLYGASVINGIQLTTANDTEARDPSLYEIYGTNMSIVSPDNSSGTDEVWTLITSGSMDLPVDRNTDGDVYWFENDASYTSYKVLFTDNKGPDGSANSIQFSEIQLYTIPETLSSVLLGVAGVGIALRRRRHV
jgi:hypothetical protein